MIYIDFLTTPGGELTGFRMAGHSGYVPEGEDDIVCAAVTSAALMSINTITDVLMVNPMSARAEYGEIFLRVAVKDAGNVSTILKGLKLHLENLEEQYPQNIKVSYLEVQ